MYQAGAPPSDPAQLPGFLLTELTKLQQALTGPVDRLRLKKLTVLPIKPRDGDVIYADGSLYNPGSGPGMYIYAGTAWTTYAGGKTNSATIGAVTINTGAGRCNIAAGASTVVVTNSLVTASSNVIATIAQNDATAILKCAVAGAGSFTITTTAAVTVNTAVNFLVIN